MRITNAMTTNSLLLNLQRNMQSLDKLQYQAATGNKIQYASDNPIIAGRSLKFRTNVEETNQYITNVKQAVSWMSTTASPLDNINEILSTKESTSIRGKLVLAANDSYTIEDRQKFSAEIRELLKDFTGQLNTTYAGRYVFSGYRTDEPALFYKDEPNKSYTITQKFTLEDIEKTSVYAKIGEVVVPPATTPTPVIDSSAMPIEYEVYRTKIAYDDVIKYDNMTNLVLADGDTDTALTASLGLSSTDVIYYDTIDSAVADGAYPPPKDGTAAAIFIGETGELLMNEAAYKEVAGEFSIQYDKKGFKENDINPIVYFDCTDNNSNPPIKYTMDNQAIKYEFGTNTRLQINTLAKDVITPELLNDINRVLDLIDNANLSTESDLYTKYQAQGLIGDELDEAVQKQLEDERQFYNSKLGEEITKLIGKVDKHSGIISKEETALGARINRIELIGNRLAEDKINYETLKTENESADLDEVLINLSVQLAVYQSALQVGANLMQLSLVNFVN